MTDHGGLGVSLVKLTILIIRLSLSFFNGHYYSHQLLFVSWMVSKEHLQKMRNTIRIHFAQNFDKQLFKRQLWIISR